MVINNLPVSAEDTHFNTHMHSTPEMSYSLKTSRIVWSVALMTKLKGAKLPHRHIYMKWACNKALPFRTPLGLGRSSRVLKLWMGSHELAGINETRWGAVTIPRSWPREESGGEPTKRWAARGGGSPPACSCSLTFPSTRRAAAF